MAQAKFFLTLLLEKDYGFKYERTPLKLQHAPLAQRRARHHEKATSCFDAKSIVATLVEEETGYYGAKASSVSIMNNHH
uniref:Uncharacterized protein n=1 Tax=Anaerobacillus isosaccharinicus TaxID=1532552 RepID=A0A1S2MDT3_9BACI